MRARSDPLRVSNELRVNLRAYVAAGTRSSRFFAVLPAEESATSKLNMGDGQEARFNLIFHPLIISAAPIRVDVCEQGWIIRHYFAKIRQF